MFETFCPYCNKTCHRCSDPPACIMGETACSESQALWNAEQKLIELETELNDHKQLFNLLAIARNQPYQILNNAWQKVFQKMAAITIAEMEKQE